METVSSGCKAPTNSWPRLHAHTQVFNFEDVQAIMFASATKVKRPDEHLDELFSTVSTKSFLLLRSFRDGTGANVTTTIRDLVAVEAQAALAAASAAEGDCFPALVAVSG